MKLLSSLLIIYMIFFCFCKKDIKTDSFLKLNEKTYHASLNTNKKILAVNGKKYIHIIPLIQKSEYKKFKMDIKEVGEVCFQDNKHCLISRGYMQHGDLILMNINDGSYRKLKYKGITEVCAISYSSKNSTVATAHANGGIVLWDINSGKIIKMFGDYETEIFELKISFDGNTIYTGNSQGIIKSWSLNSGEKLNTIKIPNINSIFTFALNRNKNMLIVGGSDGIIGILSLDDFSVKNTIKVSQEAILSCDCRNSDSKIICGLTDGYIATVNLDGTDLKNIKIHNKDIRYVKFIDGGTKIISISENGVIKISNTKDLF